MKPKVGSLERSTKLKSLTRLQMERDRERGRERRGGRREGEGEGRRGQTQMTTVRNKSNITTDVTGKESSKGIISHQKELYTNKCNNLMKPTSSLKDRDYRNCPQKKQKIRPVTSKETSILTFLTKASPGTVGSPVNLPNIYRINTNPS